MSSEPQDQPIERELFWKRIARRWSGRGRLRSVLIIVLAVLANINMPYNTIGLGLFLFGLLVHIASKGHLIRNTELCQSGPYGWIRHPFYLSNLLIDLGLILYSGLPWVALAYLIVFPLAYLPRLLAEEEMLRKKYPGQFPQYEECTPRFFPGRLPRLHSWLSSVVYERLRLENEISRAIRLCAYPFLLATCYLLRTTSINAYSDLSLITFLGLTAASLLIVSKVIHVFVEDGQSRDHLRALGLLRYIWIVLPVLCIFPDPHLSAQRYSELLPFAGGILFLFAMIIQALPTTATVYWITIPAAVGFGFLAGQPSVIPVLITIIWAGWFFCPAEAQPRHIVPGVVVPSISVMLHTICEQFH